MVILQRTTAIKVIGDEIASAAKNILAGRQAAAEAGTHNIRMQVPCSGSGSKGAAVADAAGESNSVFALFPVMLLGETQLIMNIRAEITKLPKISRVLFELTDLWVGGEETSYRTKALLFELSRCTSR